MSSSGFPGRRVDAYRAGMTTKNSTGMRRARSRLFLGGKLARFVLEHGRDAVADRKREPIGLARQLLALLVEQQGALAHGTDEDVEQFCVHALLTLCGRIAGAIPA